MEALIIGARGNDMQGDSKRRETQPFLAERHRRAGWVLGVRSHVESLYGGLPRPARSPCPRSHT